MAGGLAGKSELNQFKENRAQVGVPSEDRCRWKQSPLRYLPGAIRQSCLNRSSGISKDDQELRVCSETAAGKSRVRFEDEGPYLFVFSALL